MYSKARSVHECGRGIASQQDAKVLSGMTWNNIGETYRAQGRWKVALKCYRSAFGIVSDVRTPFWSLPVNCNVVDVLVKSGYYADSHAELRNHLALSRQRYSVDVACDVLNA